MDSSLLHTPEGVRDIYGQECAWKLKLQSDLHHVLQRYGFQDIQTPTFEFFDIFSREVGTTPSRDLYKFFDREGNTLVLRPDFTPSVVRSAAKYYGEDTLPVRLCYQGNAFINESAVYQGRLKETTQMGAELFGDDSLEADAEMIALSVEMLKASGLTRFQVEIGEVEFFKGLLEDAGLNEKEGSELRELISNKSFFGIDEFLSARSIDEKKKQVFLQLTQAFGSIDVIRQARGWSENPKAIAAIDRLLALYDCLTEYDCCQYVSFDLGMLSKYNYYTGIIFKAYTYGLGEPIAKGGRYDDLMKHFGAPSPAMGFVIVIDQLMAALERQKLSVPEPPKQQLLVYRPGQFGEAIKKARQLRSDGQNISLYKWVDERTSDEIRSAAARMGMQSVLFINE